LYCQTPFPIHLYSVGVKKKCPHGNTYLNVAEKGVFQNPKDLKSRHLKNRHINIGVSSEPLPSTSSFFYDNDNDDSDQDISLFFLTKNVVHYKGGCGGNLYLNVLKNEVSVLKSFRFLKERYQRNRYIPVLRAFLENIYNFREDGIIGSGRYISIMAGPIGPVS